MTQPKLKIPLCLSILFLSSFAYSQQLPMGLYEGLLGNSGTAISDSTAASSYNPSLLRDRTDNAFSIGGNTFGSASTRASGSEFQSLNLSPNYLSSVLSGSALVHEFFFAPLFSGPMKVETKVGNSITKTDINLTSARFGYSMAFKSIPFALQFLGRYSQQRSFGFFEDFDSTTTTSTTGNRESDSQYLGASLGVSGHTRFSGYSIGFNFISRGLDLYKKSTGNFRTFTRTPTTYTAADTAIDAPRPSEAGHHFAIGHEFKSGDHQFLTDTNLNEDASLTHTYEVTQSFGYKMNSSKGHQFLCGINHRLGPEIRYFGQSTYSSVGYSWLTRSLRSAFGLYHSNSQINDQISTAYGLTFASEFQY